MGLANDLFISFIFLKNQVLVLLIFAIVSFVSFSFISTDFYDFFSSTNFGVLHFFFFLVSLGVKLGYLFDFSLVSFGKLVFL